ncbi:glutathione S-transferase U25-like [Actinia tenebrosa]|uniref:Glutathione S-transferase omega n=1 Tax=Actinia tenebrosa TaxID=6105 RepID=A0A6P8GZL7_ACTTE|nr:glutathione S-transferase U25-like [Actinia tenebrosa]
MADSKPKLYTAWFCPFAQRAWIAMLAKKVDFEYIEQNPYNKTPEWMAISPTGLVPVIVHDGNTVYESSVCIEYIDEAFSSDVSLLPKDPYQRAYARIWGDFLSKNVIPHFYAILLKQTEEEQNRAKEQYLDGIRKITAAMKPEGSYFQQKSLGYFDIMLAPFAQRMPVLKHFKGFEIPDTPEFARYHKWWESVKRHSAVVPTLRDTEDLIQMYERYAHNTTKSLVSQAVRKGQPLP